jgi:predicted neuraminidase
MFYSGLVYVDDLLHGGHSGKFTPIEVAQWLEAFTTIAEQSHAAAKKFSNPNGSIRRLEEDVLIQIALAEYSYPALIQMPDGTIMVSYTCRRQTIKVVSFQED